MDRRATDIYRSAMADGGRIAGSDIRQELLDRLTSLKPALRAYIRPRVRNEADLEDILQTVAIRVLSGNLPEKIANKGAFLFSVASNLLRDQYRRDAVRHVEGHLPIYDLELADDAIGPEQSLDGRQRLERLEDAVNGLDPETRSVMLLHRFEGLTLQETSERTGLTTARVRKLLARGLAVMSRRVWSD